MRARDDEVLVRELRVVNALAVGLDVGDARARVGIAFDDAPVEYEIARRRGERDGNSLVSSEKFRPSLERDVERVANVAVVLGARAREFARDARINWRLRGLLPR